MKIDEKTIDLFGTENAGVPLVVLNTFAAEGAKVWEACRTLGCPPFTLAALSGLDWDADMSPWAIPPIYKGEAPCSGGADAYLARLEGVLLPEIRKALPQAPCFMAIAGYSLAGLFALYALYRTDSFARAASVSGSLWFPRFTDFARGNVLKRTPEKLYFSLGDAEARTKNPMLKSVQVETETLVNYFSSLGIDTTFELNPGNHFRDPEIRTAKGIKSLLAAS